MGNDILKNINITLGDFADDFKEESKKYAEYISICISKIASGSVKLKKEYQRNLKHLEAQILIDNYITVAKMKLKGYSAFKNVISLVTNTIINCLC